MGDVSVGGRRVGSTAWSAALPVLSAGDVVLREVRESDADALMSQLTTPEMTRYISRPPSTAESFAEFISASRRLRARGEGACFAITHRDIDRAIGLFQVRLTASTEPEANPFGGVRGDVAEWGFAVASSYWGTGTFQRAADLVIAFVFEHMGVHRLEARCALKNGRGGRALVKIGAVAEGILRKGFVSGDEHLDQVLYAIVIHDWRAARDRAGSTDVAALH